MKGNESGRECCWMRTVEEDGRWDERVGPGCAGCLLSAGGGSRRGTGNEATKIKTIQMQARRYTKCFKDMVKSRASTPHAPSYAARMLHNAPDAPGPSDNPCAACGDPAHHNSTTFLLLHLSQIAAKRNTQMPAHVSLSPIHSLQTIALTAH